MTNSIKSILDSNAFNEPEEIRIIKDFVKEHFDSDCQVAIGKHSITIVVSSAGLAGSLRMKLHELQELYKTDKKLLIRIAG